MCVCYLKTAIYKDKRTRTHTLNLERRLQPIELFSSKKEIHNPSAVYVRVYGHGNIEQMRGGEMEEEADGKQEIIMSQDIHF